MRCTIKRWSLPYELWTMMMTWYEQDVQCHIFIYFVQFVFIYHLILGWHTYLKSTHIATIQKKEKKAYICIYINLHDVSINISPLSDGLKVSEEKKKLYIVKCYLTKHNKIHNITFFSRNNINIFWSKMSNKSIDFSQYTNKNTINLYFEVYK